MSKVCDRWIPRVLSIQQKQQRVADGNAVLKKRYRNHGNRFLESNITADENVGSLYEPETKQTGYVCKTLNSPSHTKALVRTSAKKTDVHRLF